MSARTNRTYYQLQKAAHALRKSADRTLAASGLTTAQVGALVVIADEEPVAQGVVAERLGLRDSAVTAMVRRLDELGYIQRTLHESDARIRMLSVSPAGKVALTAAGPAFAEVNSLIESVLTPVEVVNFSRQLARMVDACNDGQDTADQSHDRPQSGS